jgi:hypothetical protein
MLALHERALRRRRFASTLKLQVAGLSTGATTFSVRVPDGSVEDAYLKACIQPDGRQVKLSLPPPPACPPSSTRKRRRDPHALIIDALALAQPILEPVSTREEAAPAAALSHPAASCGHDMLHKEADELLEQFKQTARGAHPTFVYRSALAQYQLLRRVLARRFPVFESEDMRTRVRCILLNFHWACSGVAEEALKQMGRGEKLQPGSSVLPFHHMLHAHWDALAEQCDATLVPRRSVRQRV